MSSAVRLRPASEKDRERLFSWRNDPWIVSLGLSDRRVTWEEHCAWFARALSAHEDAAGEMLLYIIESETALPMGALRFNREGHHADVSIYLLQPFTGKGHGVAALNEGCRLARAHWNLPIHAKILKNNAASHYAFQKAGFRSSGEDASSLLMVLHAATP